jgi:CheY-like chemotaxis protein
MTPLARALAAEPRMGEPDDRRAHRSSVDHLRSLGIEMEPLAGERCARGTLRLAGGPLAAAHGSLDARSVRFATVGAGTIKCLEPPALFHLPLIPIHGCASAAEIEGRIRAAWHKHAQGLRAARDALERIGFAPRASAGGMLLEVAIGLEGESVPVRLHDLRRALLPTGGPLAGRRVDAPEDRVARIDATATSVTEVEIALTTRMEEIARRVDRARDAERRAASERVPEVVPAPSKSAGARRILVVGPILGRDKALLDALRRWGYRLRLEYSANDALGAFRDHTFDLVLADAHLGRSEGIELVPEINALPGIDRLPVVIVDERNRPALRTAAREVGAAGYLVHPIAPERVAPGLRRMADGERGRRYSRLPQRLSVAWVGGASGYTNTIGRLGMFVTVGDAPEPAEGTRCEVLLPELGQSLRVDTQVAYRIESAGARDAGLGLRIRAFPDRNEATWIDYLTSLLRSAPHDED